VQVAPPGEKIFVRGARLSILNRAQNDPIFQRTEASIWSEWLRSRPCSAITAPITPTAWSKRGRSAILPVRLVRMHPHGISCLLGAVGKCAFSNRKPSGVSRESADKRFFGSTGSRGIRSFSQPAPALPFEPCRRHFRGQS
jgi:hypothetical protein